MLPHFRIVPPSGGSTVVVNMRLSPFIFLTRSPRLVGRIRVISMVAYFEYLVDNVRFAIGVGLEGQSMIPSQNQPTETNIRVFVHLSRSELLRRFAAPCNQTSCTR